MKLTEIYIIAKSSKTYYDFENNIAKAFFNRPATEVTTHLTDKLELK